MLDKNLTIFSVALIRCVQSDFPVPEDIRIILEWVGDKIKIVTTNSRTKEKISEELIDPNNKMEIEK